MSKLANQFQPISFWSGIYRSQIFGCGVSPLEGAILNCDSTAFFGVPLTRGTNPRAWKQNNCTAITWNCHRVGLQTLRSKVLCVMWICVGPWQLQDLKDTWPLFYLSFTWDWRHFHFPTLQILWLFAMDMHFSRRSSAHTTLFPGALKAHHKLKNSWVHIVVDGSWSQDRYNMNKI